MFTNTLKDFGKIKEKTTQSATFTSDNRIVAATPDCGCTVASIVDKTLIVSVDMPRVPASMTEYNWSRNIVVNFEGGSSQTLNLKAVLTK